MVSGARRLKRSVTLRYSVQQKVKDLTDADLEKLREEVGKLTIEGDLRREITMNIQATDGFWAATAASVIAVACRCAVSAPASQRTRTRKGPAQGCCSTEEVIRVA